MSRLPQSWDNVTCESPEDRELTCRVRQKIDSSRLKGWAGRLEMCCDQGTVTLTGQLPLFYMKQILQTIVGRVPGVDQVKNEVQVDSAAAKYTNGELPDRRAAR